MKVIKNIGIIILTLCFMLSIFNMTTYAASGTVSVSSASATVGNNVTITCTVKCNSGPIGYANVILEYNQSGLQFVSATNMAQGGNGSVRYVDTGDGSVRQLSFSMTFKVLNAGSHKVTTTSVKGSEFVSEDEFSAGNTSGTITGKAPTTKPSTGNGGGTTTTNPSTPATNKDGNNKLNSLQVYPGTMEPGFSADVTEYTVTVPGDTTEVTISATAQSSKATVSVSGGKELKLGPNEAKVIVTAENGTATSYNITIMCGEIEKIQIAGVDYTINENFTDEQIPNGFARTKVGYKERQYEALTNDKGNLVLMSLQAGESVEYFIYNQEKQEFYQFVQITLSEGKYIIPLPLKQGIEDVEGLETFSFPFQEKSIDAWLLDEEFSVIYAMNQDGEELLYKYDPLDGTFQRYKSIVTESVEEEPKAIFPNEYYMYATLGLGAFSFILLIVLICVIASRKSRHEGRKTKAVRKIEKQKAREEKERIREEIELEKMREAERIAMEKQRVKEEKRLAREKKRNKEE